MNGFPSWLQRKLTIGGIAKSLTFCNKCTLCLSDNLKHIEKVKEISHALQIEIKWTKVNIEDFAILPSVKITGRLHFLKKLDLLPCQRSFFHDSLPTTLGFQVGKTQWNPRKIFNWFPTVYREILTYSFPVKKPIGNPQESVCMVFPVKETHRRFPAQGGHSDRVPESPPGVSWPRKSGTARILPLFAGIGNPTILAVILMPTCHQCFASHQS